ncbi:MAG: sulfite exporter TauE/SafE family protein [Deltaproteobacteria bacterium]|nr:sulfite exporter TauE/SafE family protein [Deltaproteobacteria bacterium]
MKRHVISFAIGLAAGAFGGLIGLGGGVIMVPLMVGILKLSQHRAHGTSLVALVFTGAGGALIYGLRGHVDFWAAAALAATAVFTVRAGARYADALPGWKLKRAFGLFLIFCAALLALKPYLPATFGDHSGPVNIVIFLATGAITGFLSGMMGIGGGTIMIPAMVLLAGFGQHVAQGTALAVMIPAGLAGAHAHHQLGNVAQNHLPGLIAGILVGTFCGGNIAGFIPDAPLRIAFTAGIVFMGWRYARTVSPRASDIE